MKSISILLSVAVMRSKMEVIVDRKQLTIPAKRLTSNALREAKTPPHSRYYCSVADFDYYHLGQLDCHHRQLLHPIPNAFSAANSFR